MDLFDFMYRFPGWREVSDEQRAFCAREILIGVKSLHSQKYVHCDIQDGNILIGQDWGPKLIDFEIARTEGQRGKLMGAINFQPPEVVRALFENNEGIVAERSADIWSAGVVLYCLYYGQPGWFAGVSNVEKGRLLMSRMAVFTPANRVS